MKDFEILQSLGEGTYASVFKVRRRQDQQIYALKKVKILQLSQKQKQNALNQVRLLASINCPHIISYRDAFIDKQSNSLCLITQYADDGDLEQLISIHKNSKTKIQQNKIWNIFTQIAKALKTLHFANIIHRDLKSANVFLFKDGRVKLGDMNVSKVLRDRLCFTQTGTPYYASPQIWKDIPYNQKSDIWSLGCITYQMAALDPPFKSKSMEGLYKKILKGIYPKLGKQYTNNLKNIIRKMLQIDMNYRPSAQILLQSSVNTNRTQIENNQESQEDQIILLQTIKVSKKNLRISLPKPNYEMKKKISLRVLPSIDNHRGMQSYKTINSIVSPKYLSEGLLPQLKIKKKQ